MYSDYKYTRLQCSLVLCVRVNTCYFLLCYVWLQLCKILTSVLLWTAYLKKGKSKGKVFPLQVGVAQRVCRVIALLFHDSGTRRGWVVSPTPRPHFTPRKDPVPILRGAGWAPEPFWTDGKSRPHRDSIPDRPARSQSLYRLNYPIHT